MRYIISLSLASLVAALPALAEPPRVVTDLAPVHALAAQVMGDIAEPALLLDRGADAHSFQLRPSQTAALSGADLVVWIGPEMTPWLERAMHGIDGSARVLRLLSAEGTHLRDFAAHGGTEGEAGHDPAAQGEDAHAHGPVDPHAWLDPANASLWLDLIAAELGQIDPQNAAAYAANAAAAQQDIATLDRELTALLAPARGKPFVVYHDAYGYFAAHYGLDVAGSLALGDAAAPGAARLAALRSMLKDGGAQCLFPEAGHDPKMAAQLVEGTGARLGAPLDPEGALLDPGPGLYGALMRGLAVSLAECLSQG